MNITNKESIADTGARGHFFLPVTAVNNFQPEIKPISINIPDGSKLRSIHTCNLDIDGIPETAKLAHIVPGRAHASLISISVLCDTGCKVKYDENICSVYYNKKLLLKVGIEPQTQLWILPLQDCNATTSETETRNTKHMANSSFSMTSNAALIKYLYQAEFSPPKKHY